MVKKNYDDLLSRFHLVPERNGQTDRQICYINIARQYVEAIKRVPFFETQCILAYSHKTLQYWQNVLTELSNLLINF